MNKAVLRYSSIIIHYSSFIAPEEVPANVLPEVRDAKHG